MFDATQRVFQRMRFPAKALGLGFAALTFTKNLFVVFLLVLKLAYSLITSATLFDVLIANLGIIQWIRENLLMFPVVVIGGGFIGVIVGAFVGMVGKSLSFKQDDWQIQPDRLGFIGAGLGFAGGSYLGFIDRDNVVRCLGYELNSIVTGMIVGLMVGSFLGAILGESISPSISVPDIENESS